MSDDDPLRSMIAEIVADTREKQRKGIDLETGEKEFTTGYFLKLIFWLVVVVLGLIFIPVILSHLGCDGCDTTYPGA